MSPILTSGIGERSFCSRACKNCVSASCVLPFGEPLLALAQVEPHSRLVAQRMDRLPRFCAQIIEIEQVLVILRIQSHGALEIADGEIHLLKRLRELRVEIVAKRQIFRREQRRMVHDELEMARRPGPSGHAGREGRRAADATWRDRASKLERALVVVHRRVDVVELFGDIAAKIEDLRRYGSCYPGRAGGFAPRETRSPRATKVSAR